MYSYTLGDMFPCGAVALGPGIVTAVTQVPAMAQVQSLLRLWPKKKNPIVPDLKLQI